MSPMLLLRATGCAVALFSAPGVWAQALLLKDGRTLSEKDLAFDKDGFVLARNEGGATIERRTPYAEVVRMEWPAPEGLAAARTALDAAKHEEAARLAEGVMRSFEATRGVAGTPWVAAANVRVAALAALGREIEVAAVMKRMEDAGQDASALLEARLALAEASLKRRAHAEVRAQLDAVQAVAKGELAARAWLVAGDLAYDQGNFEESLRAYLRLPTFFGLIDRLQPRSLLGAARAYRGLGENERAARTLAELQERYPQSPEAVLAAAEKPAAPK